ncbi:MAG: glycosyltransferase [Tannerellaceae bacterium]|nr:glycosyltransferase [Tannerellaceae bacterium]
MPLVGEPSLEAKERGYCTDGKLRVLCVGKYREYKTISLLIEALSLLQDHSTIKVTIVGQAVSSDEKAYYQKITDMISKLKLKDTVTLKKNIPHERMKEIYLNHDLLILPSKRECASIAVLEGMANGLAVISTDHNGTATYIDPGTGGFVFEAGVAQSLAELIERYVNNNIVEKHGRAAYKIIA